MVDAKFNGGNRPRYFKVVTYNRRSLGLRNNPTILRFYKNKWVTSPTIKYGKSDEGGIWVTSTLSNARSLKKYMKTKYSKNCRIYEVDIGDILYQNSYRTKTDKVKLIRLPA